MGLITSRFTGLEFGVGVFVGLGGILVCSMLGGMRAVTWTQVAQYIILIIAYLTPVVWLGIKHTGIPVPQLAYGYTHAEGDRAREEDHRRPQGAWRSARSSSDRAAAANAALKDPAKAYADGKAERRAEAWPTLKAANAPADQIAAAEKALAAYPEGRSRRQGPVEPGKGPGRARGTATAARHSRSRARTKRRRTSRASTSSASCSA